MAKKTVTVRLDDETRRQIVAYQTATGCKTEATAIRELVETGLLMSGSTLLTSPLTRFIREVMQGQLDLFRQEMDTKADQIEDRVAQVCSRGTKASLHTAALTGDLARAVVPAFQHMSAEDLWHTYARMGGAVQQGQSFTDARRQAREG